jgi:hypothetical protein
MKSIKYILTLIVACSAYLAANAQGDVDERLEKFQSNKIAFITEKLKLTPKEAQIFWPVYNEFDTKRQNLNKERLEAAKNYQKNQNTLTEKEASDLADLLISLQKKEALLAEEYNTKFKGVLPATKVVKLYQAELQFKRELLKKLKEGTVAGKRKD